MRKSILLVILFALLMAPLGVVQAGKLYLKGGDVIESEPMYDQGDFYRHWRLGRWEHTPKSEVLTAVGEDIIDVTPDGWLIPPPKQSKWDMMRTRIKQCHVLFPKIGDREETVPRWAGCLGPGVSRTNTTVTAEQISKQIVVSLYGLGEFYFYSLNGIITAIQF